MIKNVVLITIDSLRADHLSCLGYPKKTTPNLDKLAENGILFTQAFSNAPGTSTSFPSILSSTYPLQYGFSEYLSHRRVLISEVLKRNGYLTCAIHSNPYLSSYYGYNRGFDIFRDFLFDSYGIQEKIELKRAKKYKKIKIILGKQNYIYKVLRKFYRTGLRITRNRAKKELGIQSKFATAELINKEIISYLEKISNINQKFFIWIHYMDVHLPYLPPKKVFNLQKYLTCNRKEAEKLNEKIFKNIYEKKLKIENDELEKIIELYDAEIMYVDESIRSILDELKKLNLLDSTLIIVTADHGDEFLEHGDIAHTPKLYDELLHVPLIFYAPELGKNIIINDLISLIDLAPTILDILKIEKPKEWMGESLLPLIKGERKSEKGVISEIFHNGRKTSYRTKKWKFIVDEEKNAYELYNLTKDPRELNNVAEIYPNIAEEFSLKIREHILMEERTRKEEEKDIIKERIRGLKARGKI